MADDLQALFNPNAIAVVGATDTGGRAGRIVFELLNRSRRPVYPVHPEKKEIFGRKVYRRIGDLPEKVDLAVIAVAADSAVEAAEECAEHGIPYLIVLAGGFGEAGPKGIELEKRIRAIPGDSGTRVLGPNSLGIFLPGEKLDTIFVEHGDKALSGGGTVAFISQSGSVGVEALGLASNTGFGLRAFVGLGNKSDLDELDFLRYFSGDPETRCLAFYLESLEAGRQFLEEACRVSADKPVLVLKAGRTTAGASAVSSHTGRLAGSDSVVSGAFRQFGIQRVIDDEELCDAAKALSCLPPAPGDRVAVLTAAGGYGVMCADYIESSAAPRSLRMAQLQERTKERIKEKTFPFASCDNPVDLTASATDAMFGDSIDVLLADDGVDLLICIAFFAPPGISQNLVSIVADRASAAGSAKPVLAFTQYGPFTDEYLRRFYERGVVGFPSIYRTVRAAGFLVERAEIIQTMQGRPCA